MPRITSRGEDGTRVVLTGLPFTQVPDAALALSGNAFKLLGRLQRLAGSSSSTEVDDAALGEWIQRSRQTVQRAWTELEAAGLVERRRRSNRRRIVLLYTLASRETRGPEVVHACTTPRQPSEPGARPRLETCMAQERDTHGPELGRPSFSKQEEHEQQQRAGCAAGVVALSPEEEEEAPPARSAFLADLVADLADALTSPTKGKGGATPARTRAAQKEPRPQSLPGSPDKPSSNTAHTSADD